MASQDSKINSTNVGLYDHFGSSIGITNGYKAIVSAPNNDNIGNVYVYTNTTSIGGTWSQTTHLISSNVIVGDQYGYAVAICGGTNPHKYIVSAPSKADGHGAVYIYDASYNETEILGPSELSYFGDSVKLNDDGSKAIVGATGVGNAYILTSSSTYALASGTTLHVGSPSDYFGFSVDLSGSPSSSYSIVGAPGAGNGTGKAYIYNGATLEATFPLNVSGTLYPSELVEGDYFGNSVALDRNGETAVVGAFLQNSQGAAHVFVRSGTTWSYQSKIVPNDIQIGDSFGDSVAISDDGDTIVVGASSKLSGGAMYTFIRSGTTWTQREKIVSSNLTTGDKFGYSVGISPNGRKAIAGAYAATSSSNIFSGGSAYAYSIPDNYYSGTNRIIHETVPETEPVSTFEKFNIYVNGQPVENTPTTWAQSRTMIAPSTNPDGSSNIFFGNVEYTNGLTTLEPGSKLHVGNFTLLSRNAYDTWDNTALDFYNEGPPNQMLSVGGDAIIEHKLGIGTQTPEKPLHLLGDIRVSDPFPTGTVVDISSKSNILREVSEIIPVSRINYEIYGYSMSMSRDGKIAVISALQNLPGNETYGHVYIFIWKGNEWEQNTIIKPDNPISNDGFGSSVSITPDGKTILIGSFRDNSAYIFKYSGTKWYQDSKITPSDRVAGMQFGYSVDISEDGATLAIGAPFTTVGGTVYMYSVVSDGWEETKLNPYKTVTGGTSFAGGSTNIFWSPAQGINDRFGCSISMTPDGKTILIGAYNATISGVFGYDHNNNSTTPDIINSGAAFIFKLDTTGWVQQSWYPGTTFPFPGDAVEFASTDQLTAAWRYTASTYRKEVPHVSIFSHGHPTTDIPYYGYYPGSGNVRTHPPETGTYTGDRFGWSTAISDDGNTIAIGAPGRKYVHDLPDNDVKHVELEPQNDHGTVYIFEWVKSNATANVGSIATYSDASTTYEWLEQARISRPDGAIDFQFFGSEIALNGNGDTLIIGSHREGGGTHRTYSNVVASKLDSDLWSSNVHVGSELAIHVGAKNTGSIYVYERGKSGVDFIDKEQITWTHPSHYSQWPPWPILRKNVTTWRLKGKTTTPTGVNNQSTSYRNLHSQSDFNAEEDNSFFGRSLALSGDGHSILVAAGLSAGLIPERHIPFESGSKWVHPNNGTATTVLDSKYHYWRETTKYGDHLYGVSSYAYTSPQGNSICKYSPISKKWSILPGLSGSDVPGALTYTSTYSPSLASDTLVNPDYVYAWNTGMAEIMWSFKNPYKTTTERSGAVYSYSLPDEFSKSYYNTLNVPSNLYVRDSIYTTESVGIKTSQPERPLHIDGDVRISDNTEIVDFSVNKGLVHEESVITLPISGDGDIVSENDHVGERVRISGDGYTAFVSSHTHGGPNFYSGAYQHPKGGKVQVYVRSGYKWTLQATLQPDDINNGDDFGISFGSTPDGNKLVVAAQTYSAVVSGTNYSGSGGIWVYKREGTTWSIESSFVPEEVHQSQLPRDKEIDSISISDDGTRIVAGSHSITRDNTPNKGRIYVFEMSRNGIWTQQTLVCPTDSLHLGIEVSISGDGNTIAAGAPESDTTGTSGNAGGAVYIFMREETQTLNTFNNIKFVTEWKLGGRLASDPGATDSGKIVPTDIEANMFFGCSCSLSNDGNTLVIGARDANYPGGTTNIGAVYIFTRSNGIWSQEAKLFPNDPVLTGGSTNFAPTNGISISSDGNRIAIGRTQPSNTKYPAVYIFDREDTTWLQFTKLTPNDGDSREYGYCVALSSVGDRVIVGDIIKEINGIIRAGAAYIYNLPLVDNTTLNISSSVRSQGGLKVHNDTGIGTLAPGKKLHVVGDIRLSGNNENVDLSVIPVSTTLESQLTIASQYSRSISNRYGYKPRFGHSSSLSYDGNIAVVGAPWDNYVYVFKRSGTIWTEQTKLTSSNVFTSARSSIQGEVGDQFGYDVAISGDGKTIAVGTSTVNTNEEINTERVYIFTRSGYKWIEEAEIMTPLDKDGNPIHPNSSETSGFGQCVAISENGNHLAIGAPRAKTTTDNPNAISNQTHGGAPYISTPFEAGAVFMYYRQNGIWILEDSIYAHSPQDGWIYGSTNYGPSNFVEGGMDAQGTSNSNNHSYLGNDYNYKFGSSLSMSANGWKLAVGAWGAEYMRGKVFIFERGEYKASTNTGTGSTLSPRWQEYGGQTYGTYVAEKGPNLKLMNGYFLPQTVPDTTTKKWAQRQKITKTISEENLVPPSDPLSSWAMTRDEGDMFGWKVCLSGDGNVLAISTCEDSPGTNTDQRWYSGTWPNETTSPAQNGVGRVYMYNWFYGADTSNVHFEHTAAEITESKSGLFVPYDYDGNVSAVMTSIGGYVPARLWTTTETEGGRFGSSISLSYTGHIACVGAEGEKGPDDKFGDGGAMYIFTSGDPTYLTYFDTYPGNGITTLTANTKWLQRKWSRDPERIYPSDISVGGNFGASMCMDKEGTRVLIGAPYVGGNGRGYIYNISPENHPSTAMNLSSSLQFPSGKYIEFGSDIHQKETNAGKIGLGLFSNCLDIVGYHKTAPVGQRYSENVGAARSVKIWDHIVSPLHVYNGSHGESSIHIQAYSDYSGDGDQAALYLGTPHHNDSRSQPKCAIIAKTVGWSRSNLHFCLEGTANNGSSYKASTANTKMMIDGITGNVGIGIQSPGAKLVVNGSSNAGSFGSGSGRYFNYNSGMHLTSKSGSTSGWYFSIRASNDIGTSAAFISHSGSWTSSDSRIKTNINDVTDASALEKIRLLEPKTYNYIDTNAQGDTTVYGFIAQEVSNVFPEAVGINSKAIPNIYELSNVSDSNVITFTNFNTSDLLTSNVTSKIEVKSVYDKIETLTLDTVIDSKSIRVKEDLTDIIGSIDDTGNVVSGNQVFVMGQEVDNFNVLKKEYIFTIATAALQEVDRQLQAEKTKVATLETQVADLLARVTALENN